MGHFITVEGIDGSGKTTVVEELWKEIDDSVRTAEPTDWPTGQHLRDCLSGDLTSPKTDFFAFMSDRVHHIEHDIEPALDRGKTVVCDRYTDSTRAYQGQYLDRKYMERVMEPMVLEPDLTFYLDCDPSIAAERFEGDEKFEEEEFLESVNESYYELYTENDRIVRIDANRSEKDVIEGVRRLVDIYEL